MFTANMDGSELRLVIPFGSGVSHFGWRNDEEIIATFYLDKGNKEMNHVLFSDRDIAYEVVGKDLLIGNGHCTFSPNSRWLTTDRKERESISQTLWLYDYENKKGMVLCQKPMFERHFLHSPTRCDFHPRWSPSGNQICFDAIDTRTQTRQLHIVDLYF